MKTYLYTHSNAVALQQSSIYRKALFLLFSTLISFFAFAGNGRGSARQLDFKNSTLISGVAGQDGATYKFPRVDSDIDALVTIKGRSNTLVTLVDIDMPGMGYDKAFQPKVMYNGGTTPAGYSEWWMEFEIRFVKKDSNTPADMEDYDVTGIDIDGNGQYIRENVHFYNLKSYSVESNSLLQLTSIFELLGLLNSLVGKRFDGPTMNYLNIDTSGTAVMTTANYENVNKMRIRTGGVSSNASGASDRMYSLYFKSFRFNQESQFTLPLVLKNFNASLHNKKVNLNWVTGHEKDLSHFVVERSTNGFDYSEVAVVFAMGNSTAVQNYNYTDAVNTASKGVIYYRLRMMDSQKRFQFSPVRLVRIGDATTEVQVQAYPNPVVNELRVTVPASWQNKQVSYELYNMSGNMVKRISTNNANQTETLNVKELGTGTYVVKAYTQSETASQRIVKR
jgi:hypothetical protein